MSDPLNDCQFLEKLYTENYTLIYRVILRTLHQYTRKTSDAADLTQEVFIRAAKKISILRSHNNPTGWLIKTAYNLCKNYVRTTSAHNELLGDSISEEPSPSDDIHLSDLRMTLEQALSPDDYRLLEAYCLKNMPREQICEEFHISNAALRVRIHRLRKILKTILILTVTFAVSWNI